MSREIDPYNISEDDKTYISQRPGLRQEFILQGFGDPLSDDYDPNGSDDAGDGGDGDDSVDPGTPDPNEDTNPRPSDTGDTGDTEAWVHDDPQKRWGEGMTQPELLAVVNRRNADYDEDEKIVPESRSRENLIAALQADDEELQSEEDDAVG